MSLMKRINQYNAGISTVFHDIKWAAMRESPFRFYRATDYLFAADFEKLYKYKPKVKTWICGDAHFENFGSYKGADRIVYFDLNDFDEAILAGPEPEVARFITSVIVAAGQMGMAYVKLHKTLGDIMQAYTETIAYRKAMVLQPETAEGAIKNFFTQMSTINRPEFIAQKTIKVKGTLQIKTDNKRYLKMNKAEKVALYESLNELLKDHDLYSQMVFEDAAIRVTGTGSLGLNRYAALLFSRKKGKHYLLDIKGTRQSCNNILVNFKQPKFRNEAERIISIGNLLQHNGPAFMMPHKMGDQWYVVKELQPSADKMAVNSFVNDFARFSEVAVEMAKLIAYAHLRSSGHFGSSAADDLVAFAVKKQWQRDIIELSGALAKKNDGYYKTFCK